MHVHHNEDLMAFGTTSIILVSFLTDIAFILCHRNSERNIYILNRQWSLSGLLELNQHIGNPSGLYPINYLCDLLSCNSYPQHSVTC